MKSKIILSALAVGGLLAFLLKGINSTPPPRIVVAHWLIPMDYYPGESNIERDRDDIRAAVEEGLDGFAINAFFGPQARGILGSYIAAADAVGAKNFKLFLSVDTALKFPAQEIVETVTKFGSNPHYLRMAGKPLLSTSGSGGKDMRWWEDNVLAPLRANGQAVTFVPNFDRPSQNADPPSYANWEKTIKSYSGVDGIFNFLIPKSTPFPLGDSNLGHATWSTLDGEEQLAKALHSVGKIFMAPYMPYYWASCHSARQYVEYQGGRGMTNMWESIITRQKPEAVEIVTWNDYSESSYIQPTRIPFTKAKGITSYPHLGYYELLKYFIAWYHKGIRPSISQDAVFYFYRPNLARVGATGDSFCKLGPVSSSQIWGKPQNVVYVTTAMTSPGELRINNGHRTLTFQIPAGISTTDLPLDAGKQTIEVWRGGQRQITVNDIAVTESKETDNFNVSSGYSVANGVTSESWQPSDPAPSGQQRQSWFR